MNILYSFVASLLAVNLHFGIIPHLQNICGQHSSSGKFDDIVCGVESFVSSDNGVCCEFLAIELVFRL